MSQQQEKKQLIDPQSKALRITERSKPNAQTFIAQIYLKKFNAVELHSLGQATKTAVRVAENLQRSGLAVITKIESFTHEGDKDDQRGDQREQRGGKRVKLVVYLDVTPEGAIRIKDRIKE